jgi:hypothetical protein
MNRDLSVLLPRIQLLRSKLSRRHWLMVLLGVSVAVGATAQYSGDYSAFYRAGQALLAGTNPYDVRDYYNPLTVAVLMAPLSLLPFEIAYRIHAGIAFALYCIALWRLSGRMLFAMLLTPFVWMTVYYGNIEYLVLLGAALPAVVGIWLVTVKPQIGLVVFVLMTFELWRIHRMRSLLVLIPFAAMVGLSFALGMGRTPVERAWNISVWPWGLLPGALCMVWAIVKRDRKLGLVAAPLLSPYMTPYSWGAIMPGTMRGKLSAVALIVLGWIIVLIWRLKAPVL